MQSRNRLASAASFALVFACTTIGSAQAPGDAVLTVQSGSTTFILAVTPSGVVSTVATVNSTSFADGLTVAPGNRGALFADSGNRVMEIADGGVVTTLSSLPAAIIRVPTLLADQGGDVTLLSSVPTSRGVYRMPGSGGPLTTLATLGSSFGLSEDLRTGDQIVFGSSRLLYRVDRLGQVTSVPFVLPPVLGAALFLNAHPDEVTGLMHFTYFQFLMSVDPATGTIATLQGPGTRRYLGIDNDPYNGGLYLSVQDSGPVQRVLRYDPRNATQTTVATLPSIPNGQIVDLVCWKSWMLSGQSRPTPGQNYQIAFNAPTEANQTYVAAASGGFGQGITVGTRRIPLNADTLFFLSFQAPGLFSQFQGRLDGSGSAFLAVNLPPIPQLAGFRFFVAAVTYDTSGLRVITEPLGVTIE